MAGLIRKHRREGTATEECCSSEAIWRLIGRTAKIQRRPLTESAVTLTCGAQAGFSPQPSLHANFGVFFCGDNRCITLFLRNSAGG